MAMKVTFWRKCKYYSNGSADSWATV